MKRVKKTVELIFEDWSLLGTVRGERGTQTEAGALPFSFHRHLCWRWIGPGGEDHGYKELAG